MASYAPTWLPVAFAGGDRGEWAIARQSAVRGEALADAAFMTMSIDDGAPQTGPAAWRLRGVVSHLRYTTGREADALGAVQAPLSRPQARSAALIPIRKSSAWWALPQDERRAIYEERSRHTSIGLAYLPQIARRLHHSRDLGEPFDFLTWFEFDPAHAPQFDELLSKLRASEEWTYVDREIDIRLERVA